MTTVANPKTAEPEAKAHRGTINRAGRLLARLDQTDPTIANRMAAATWAIEALDGHRGPGQQQHIDTLTRWVDALRKALEKPTIAPYPERATPVRERIAAFEWAIDQLQAAAA